MVELADEKTKESVWKVLSTQEPFRKLEGYGSTLPGIVVETASDVLVMPEEELLSVARELDRIGSELGQDQLVQQYYEKQSSTKISEVELPAEVLLRLGVAQRLVTFNIASALISTNSLQMDLPSTRIVTPIILGQSCVYHAVHQLATKTPPSPK